MNNYFKDYIKGRIDKHKPGAQHDFIAVFIDETQNCSDPTSSFYGEEGRELYLIQIACLKCTTVSQPLIICLVKHFLNTIGDIFAAGSETTR